MSKASYAHLLSGPLLQYVEEQLERPPENQNEIQEELALMRAGAAKSVEVFNIAIEKNDDKAIFVAGQMMKKELQAVAQIAAMAAKIQATNTDQMTRQAMELIVSGIIDIVFNALRAYPDGLKIAADIEKQIQSQINTSIDRGTVTLPSDEMVLLMDKTIGEGG